MTYVDRFGAWFTDTGWIHWSVIVYLAAVVLIVAYFQRQREGYRFIDVLTDHSTGKASNAALLSFLFGGIGIWEVIVTVIRGEDATSLTLGMLAIVLGYRGAESFARRPVANPVVTTGDTANVNVGVQAPAAAPLQEQMASAKAKLMAKASTKP